MASTETSAYVRRTRGGELAASETARLVGWKAIGAFVGRDARTAKRWEGERRLPIHRVPGGKRPTVWADRDELRAWMGKGRDVDRDAAAAPDRRALFLGAGAIVAGSLGALGVARPWAERPRPEPYANDPVSRELLARADYAAAGRSATGLAIAREAYATLARRAPSEAPAYVGLAECALLSREFAAAPEAAAYDEARSFATRAIAIDPRAPAALRTLGFVAYWGHAEVASGLKLLRSAVAAAPGSARAHHWLATALGARGAWPEASAEISTASRLEPESSAVQADHSLISFSLGDRDGARAGLEEITRLDPGFSAAHAYLAHIHVIEGRDAAFLSEMAADARARGDNAMVQLSQQLTAVMSGFGPTAMRRAYAAGLEARHETGAISAFQVAEAWAMAGGVEPAIHWLELCRDRREPSFAATRGAIVLNHFLAGQARFEAIRAQL